MEVPEGTRGSLRAISMQSLLTKYNLTSFDYIKLDIEGSEWQLFRQDFNLGWLSGVKLLSLEVRMLLPKTFPCFQSLLKCRAIWTYRGVSPYC